MRIIHDVEAPMQVGCGSSPYRNIRGTQGYNGMRVEIFASTDCASNNPELPTSMFNDDESIYIEGNAKYVIDMLEKMLDVAKSAVEFSEERMGEKRPTDCPNCDPAIRHRNATHTEECPLG